MALFESIETIEEFRRIGSILLALTICTAEELTDRAGRAVSYSVTHELKGPNGHDLGATIVLRTTDPKRSGQRLQPDRLVGQRYAPLVLAADVSPLTTFLLGGGLAIVSALIGSLLTQRREHNKWLRDKRLETYATFAANLANVVTAAQDERITAMKRLHESLHSLELIGTERVIDRADAVMDQLSVHTRDPDRGAATAEAVFRRLQAFKGVGRIELGAAEPFRLRRLIERPVNWFVRKQDARQDDEALALAKNVSASPTDTPSQPLQAP